MRRNKIFEPLKVEEISTDENTLTTENILTDGEIFNEINDAIEDGDFVTFCSKLSPNLHLINSRFNDNSTLLHSVPLAVASKAKFCIEAEVEADVLEKIYKMYESFITTLILNGADINAQDKENRSPLDYAILIGEYRIAEFFIMLKVKITKTTLEIANMKVEETFLNVVEYAIHNGHFNIGMVLFKQGISINEEAQQLLKIGLFQRVPEGSLPFPPDDQMLLDVPSP